MKLLFPLLLAFLGLGGGLTTGHFLRPAEKVEAVKAKPTADGPTETAEEIPEPEEIVGLRPEDLPGAPPPRYDPEAEFEYIAIDRQFLVPLVEADEVAAMMIVSLSLEMEPGVRDAVFEREPKLRDRFLHVLFRHAQSGAFTGVFTAASAMRDLRGSLLDAARGVLGPAVHDVLVTDIMRQDL